MLPTIPAKDETPPWQLRWFPKSITNLSAGLLETHPRHPPKWFPQRCGSPNVSKAIGSTLPNMTTFRLFDWNHPYGWAGPMTLDQQKPAKMISTSGHPSDPVRTPRPSVMWLHPISDFRKQPSSLKTEFRSSCSFRRERVNRQGSIATWD